MKKQKIWILAFAVCGLTFIASCDKNDDGETPVATPSNLTASDITPTGAVLSWTSAEPAVEVKIGDATHPVTGAAYTASELTPNTAYTWQVRAKNGDRYSEWATSSFTTAETPALSVSETNIANVPANDGSHYSIVVTGNTAWVAEVDEASEHDWCTITGATGEGNGSFDINIAKNPAGARSVTVTVRATNVPDGTLDREIALAQVSVNDGETGVTIAGITWATRNVNGAGYFTNSPGEAGQYYQYGRNEAGVNAAYTPAAGAWSESATDPCPAGWRLPTEPEILTLTGDHNMIFSWRSSAAGGNYGVDGLWFGANAANATAANPQGCIFLPAAGYIDPSTGEMINQDSDGVWYGYYYAGTENTDLSGYGATAYLYLTFAGPLTKSGVSFPETATYFLICPPMSWFGMGDKYIASSLRCVKR
ncbi:MAG: hypothetical protein LBS12_04675 [Prevotellaceae bacterium]|jgi:hypothetical protein|nr:hypothetical protein [Prevotellaceae bacterium]